MSKIPAITGRQLITLLEKDGWIIKRKANHGYSLYKVFEDKTRVTVIPNTRASLDAGTLSAILGPKQTAIGRKGLEKLIQTHGL